MNPKYELLIKNVEQNAPVPFGIQDIHVDYRFEKPDIPFPYNVEELLKELNSWKEFSKKEKNIDGSMYCLAAASGVLCALLDGLGFDFDKSEETAEKVRTILTGAVRMTAMSLGSMDQDFAACLNFINRKFCMPQQKDILLFGEHLLEELELLADRADIIGLCALILLSLFDHDLQEQYGKKGKTRKRISLEEKLITAVTDWIINIVFASSADKKFAGTGIPQGIIQLAEELSKLPFFESINTDPAKLQELKQKMIENLLLAWRKNHDLHWEFISLQISHLFPVLLNEAFVRVLSAFNVLSSQFKKTGLKFGGIKLSDLNWKQISLSDQTEILLLVSAAAYSALNLADVCVESYKRKEFLWMKVNIPGIISLLIHTSKSVPIILQGKELDDTMEALKNEKKYFYFTIHKMEDPMIFRNWGVQDYPLTVEQTEILYNLEYQKTLIDIDRTNNLLNTGSEKKLKTEWLNRWKSFIEKGVPYLGLSGSMQWYSKEELIRKIEANSPWEPWFSKVVYMVMRFRPYFALVTNRKENGQLELDRRYESLFKMCNVKMLDDSFDRWFSEKIYWEKGRAAKMRKEHADLAGKLNGNSNNLLKNIVVVAGASVATAALASTFAAPIAVAVAGANFTGLSGAALTSASLAWLGGGSLAAGGFGMAGGAAVITGGGMAVGATAGSAASLLLNVSDNSYEDRNDRVAAAFVQIKYGEYLNSEQKERLKKELTDYYKRIKEEQERQIIGLEQSLSKPETDKKQVKTDIKNIKVRLKAIEKENDIFIQYCLS